MAVSTRVKGCVREPESTELPVIFLESGDIKKFDIGCGSANLSQHWWVEVGGANPIMELK